jgi:glycosyltransferase involved in cell wall biosynthesis
VEPAVTLVVPAYNEEALLPRLLDSVDVARARYSRGPEAVEVVVSDNDSTDGTAALARARGCVLARTSVRKIAAVRNAGAAVARGRILCFTDADGRIHPDTFDAVEGALEDAGVVGGATGVELERVSPGIRVTWAALMPLILFLNFDTGVVFCRRADFEEVGGYPERTRFAEDVAFLFALRRLGRSRGQKLRRITHVKAWASTRKFDEHGDWHYFPMVGKALLHLVGRGGFEEHVQRYWYDVRTGGEEGGAGREEP